MGTWGPGIFSDDTAADVRGDYRAHVEDGVPDDEATRRVVETWRDVLGDEEHLLWLALAAAQHELGRLDDDVRAKALGVLDQGFGLEPWEEAGPRRLDERREALARLREQLTGPAAPRRAVRRRWRHVTDLRPGDVLGLAGPSGRVALLRVLRVDDHRVGAAPVVERLGWSGDGIPPGRELEDLGPVLEPGPDPDDAPRPLTWRVSRQRRADLDWRDAGFGLVAQVPSRAHDGSAVAWSYVGWEALRRVLERDLAG
ncbi:hypothetical protein [Cellulosimicrobium sp. NPDC057127]|uniref:hypothetical protein n=1 Tax=Cellulosimicrobium sp. NPDC057127 TaxID=3346026 RepID=UPI00362F4A9D